MAIAEKIDAFPVVMCGGSGTRLWPASRPSRPKQFIELTGDESLFSQTVKRMSDIQGFRELVVVAGQAHENWIDAELNGFNNDKTVLLEPEGRDSAAAIAAAVAHIERINPKGIAIIVASDHHIPNPDTFREDITVACKEAQKSGIVTLGIEPSGPSTAYGYIRADFNKSAVGPVGEFVEKPDAQKAARYVAEGYLWNSGNFIARVDVLAQAFEAHAPEILAAARKALVEGSRKGVNVTLGAVFRQAPKISFDYAIMENHADRKVVRSRIDWSDLGAWDAVHAVTPKDANNNTPGTNTILLNSKGCNIHNVTNKLVVMEGLADINLIVEDDVIFASQLDRSQSVKTVVEHLKAVGRSEIDAPQKTQNLNSILKKWERWHDTAVLPLWWSYGFDHERGIWREHLDPETGAPTHDPIRARVQGRQSYVFARAGRHGWPGQWKQALEAGLAAISDVYAGPDGLAHTLVDHEGTVHDKTVFLYDQTFVLLALAEADGLIENARKRASRYLDSIEARFSRTDGGKGYREAGSHPYQSNAHMHLLEAALAWMERSGEQRYKELADNIGELALRHFIDSKGGFLREFFEQDWSPAKGRDGTVVEPGHQFEWAWLLARLSHMSGNQQYHAAAKTLFACGLNGVDAARGVAISTMDENLKPVTKRARLWQQTEWLKASVLLAESAIGSEQEFYANEVVKAAVAVDRFLSTPVPGLWRDKMESDGTFKNEMAPASSLYHIVGAIDALRSWVNHSQGASL